jgi:SulP family sulfate permease
MVESAPTLVSDARHERMAAARVSWRPAWLRGYRRDWLAADLSAGAIVTVLLVPQSLAYALLAGLPAQVGLYASILPLAAYAVFGTGMTLAVGPVAVLSLMTAHALAPHAAPFSAEYAALAAQLALLSGLMLFAFGLLRLGFVAQFLSAPVVAGFISGSAILIVLSQVGHLLGLEISATGAVQTVGELLEALPRLNAVTAALGLGTLAFYVAARAFLPGLPGRLAPMAAIVVATAIVAIGGLDSAAGVRVVGEVPAGLPRLAVPLPSLSTLAQLWLPALLIALVGFVESVSVARALSARRGERIAADGELLGLGAANLAAAASGGYAVTGSFARSVVNFSAGARTPLAGVVSALLMAGLLAGLTSWLYYLPQAALAATIIVAVSTLVDWHTLRESWKYDRSDALAFLATFAGVVTMGAEAGVITGVALSLGMLLWRASRPHIAVVGRIPGTGHFRNVERHKVQTLEDLVALRVDESLFFGNAGAVRERIERVLAAHPRATRVLLILSAVNHVDTTALGMLAELERQLAARKVTLYLAEVKGPVMDRLARSEFGKRILRRIFLSADQAFQALDVPAGPGAAPAEDKPDAVSPTLRA